MKNIILIATAILSVFSVAPAMAASVSTEVRFGDTRSTGADFQEYKVEYSVPAPFIPKYNLATELTVKQVENDGAVSAKLTPRLEANLPDVLGISPVIYAEAGAAFNQNDNFAFGGLGVKASRQIFGPVSASVGYRHRQGFDRTRDLNEDRLNVGLSYAIDDAYAVGAQYYRTTGATDYDAVGVQLVRKF
jgi:hypothetical protein